MTNRQGAAPFEISAESEERWYWPIPASLLRDEDIGHEVRIDVSPGMVYTGTLRDIEPSATGNLVQVVLGDRREAFSFTLLADTVVQRELDYDTERGDKLIR